MIVRSQATASMGQTSSDNLPLECFDSILPVRSYRTQGVKGERVSLASTASKRSEENEAYIGGVSYEALPGGDLIEKGLRDLASGSETEEALLVSIGAPRLRTAGVPVPDQRFENPERRLYELLAREDADSAHSRYNALLRRLVGFEDAAEAVGLWTRAAPGGSFQSPDRGLGE